MKFDQIHWQASLYLGTGEKEKNLVESVRKSLERTKGQVPIVVYFDQQVPIVVYFDKWTHACTCICMDENDEKCLKIIKKCAFFTEGTRCTAILTY